MALSHKSIIFPTSMLPVFVLWDKFIKCLQAALDQKSSVFICFGLAFLNKVSIAWLYTDLEDDKSLYLLLSDSALKGKLFLEPVNFYNSAVTEYIFNPATLSPLYSLLAVPLLWMTKSFVATSLLIDIISWSIFLTGIYTTAVLMLKQRWLANAFILCIGFFLYPHELASTPKDTLAVALMLWGCIFTYKIIKDDDYPLTLVGKASAAFFLLILTKFLYAPLALLFVLILHLHARKTKSKAQIYNVRVAVLILFTCTLLFAMFIFYQKICSSPLKINPDGTIFTRGFFPVNLCATFPFITSSLINTNFWGVQLQQLLGIPFSSVTRWFQIVDLLVLVWALFFGFRYYKEIRRIPVRVLLYGLFSLAIIFMVFTMSVTHKAVVYRVSGASYTYVQEARSFLLPMLTIQLLIFYTIFQFKAHLLIKIGLFSLLFFESVHGVYFTTRQLLNRENAWARQQVSSPVKRVVNRLLQMKASGREADLFATENSLRRLALVNGIDAYSLPTVCTRPLNTRRPAVVAILQSDTTTLHTCLGSRQPIQREIITPFVFDLYDIK